MSRRRTYLTAGARFGEWCVLSFSHLAGTADVYDCRCACGRVWKVQKRHLQSGASARCKVCAASTHGASCSDMFAIWSTMRGRCSQPNHSQFARYGARGITVCAHWNDSFEAFRDAVGPRPSSEHSIDRIDNDGGYWCGGCAECLTHDRPNNVRWATRREQAQNRRSNRTLTIEGATLCVAEWARIVGVNNQTIHERLKRGWSDRDAVYGKHPKESPNGPSGNR